MCVCACNYGVCAHVIVVRVRVHVIVWCVVCVHVIMVCVCVCVCAHVIVVCVFVHASMSVISLHQVHCTDEPQAGRNSLTGCLQFYITSLECKGVCMYTYMFAVYMHVGRHSILFYTPCKPELQCMRV